MSAPPGLEQISPGWLTDLLLPSGPGRVDRVVFEPLGTFTDELFRLHLSFLGVDEPYPRTLVLKRPRPGSRSRPAESFEYEIRFYRELAPKLPVRTPRLYHGSREVDGAAMLLLEDVPGLRPFDFGSGASQRHAGLAVDALASLHAATWERCAGLAWPPRFGDGLLADEFERAYARAWPALRAPLADLVPGFEPIGDFLMGRVGELLARLAAPAAWLHGDAHGENLPLAKRRDGRSEVVFLDWQGPRVGCPAVDLAFFVVMSFPVERRRELERELVLRHAKGLEREGAPGLPDPFTAYRIGVLRRAVRVIENHDSSSLSGASAARQHRMIFERCLVAAVDLEVTELLG